MSDWFRLQDEKPSAPGMYLCFGYYCFDEGRTEQFVGQWNGQQMSENRDGGEYIATHWKPIGPDPIET